MKSQHDHQKERRNTEDDCRDDESFLHQQSEDLEDLSNDPILEAQFSDLGFDLKSSRLFHAGSAGPFSVLIHRDRFGEPEDPFSLLEFRFLIAPEDRNGDILFKGDAYTTNRRIIAVQAAVLHAMDSTETAPRFIFEKTYTVGYGFPADKHRILNDIIQAERTYLQQIRNIQKFIQASQTISG